MTDPARDFGLIVGDARKALTEADFDNDELHAHLDVDPQLWDGDDT